MPVDDRVFPGKLLFWGAIALEVFPQP